MSSVWSSDPSEATTQTRTEYLLLTMQVFYPMNYGSLSSRDPDLYS